MSQKIDRISCVREYFETLDERFQAYGSTGITCVFQYDLYGKAGGTFFVEINDGSMTVETGSHSQPTSTIRMKDVDFVDMVNGDLSGRIAFMTGRLRVSGNIPMAMKMQNILPPRTDG
jgi:putative sterol carrier protein